MKVSVVMSFIDASCEDGETFDFEWSGDLSDIPRIGEDVFVSSWNASVESVAWHLSIASDVSIMLTPIAFESEAVDASFIESICGCGLRFTGSPSSWNRKHV